MSYEIEYSKHAYYVTDQWNDRNYLAFVKLCCNNVSPRIPRPNYFRHGRGWEVIGEACRVGASVESGCWKPKNQWIKPEEYIGQWRTTLQRARPLSEFTAKYPCARFRIAVIKKKLEPYLETKPEKDNDINYYETCNPIAFEKYFKLLKENKKSNDRIMQDIGKAVKILYNLDICLSNEYTGNPLHQRDKAIEGVRKPIRDALSSLESSNWIKHMEGLK